MGRHSSPEQWAFYRSVAAWFLPWVMVAAVVGAAVWVAVATVGGGEPASPVLSRGRAASPKPAQSESAPASPVEPPPAPHHKQKPSPEPVVSESAPPELITEGITVQVLNASGVDGADKVMGDRLTGLGFEVAAEVQAARIYGHTTVFWSTPDTKLAAVALAERFGWRVLPKPGNLSADVSIHVVVGQDEA